MSRRLNAVAVAVVIASFAAAACATPFKTPPPAKIMDVYSASPTSDDARSLLGGDWWTSAPTFATRPLNDTNTLSQIQYTVIRRYVNVGTAETWMIRYTQFDKGSSASSVMSNLEDSLGSGTGGKNVGDKVLYYQDKLNASADSTANGAPYESVAIIRVGSIIIQSIWNKNDGFPSSDEVGKIASRLVSGVKAAADGKVKSATASADQLAMLPPANAFITLLGAVQLPVEALPLMLNASAPTKVADLFKQEAVDNFVYGDYVLNTDTSMEVQAGVFTFNSASAAASMFDTFKGSASVDPNGILHYYVDVNGPGQYDYYIVSGRHFAFLICRSTSATEAASRACEQPLETVAAAWPSAFSD